MKSTRMRWEGRVTCRGDGFGGKKDTWKTQALMVIKMDLNKIVGKFSPS
jgi:hypothetical protein